MRRRGERCPCVIRQVLYRVMRRQQELVPRKADGISNVMQGAALGQETLHKSTMYC